MRCTPLAPGTPAALPCLHPASTPMQRAGPAAAGRPLFGAWPHGACRPPGSSTSRAAPAAAVAVAAGAVAHSSSGSSTARACHARHALGHLRLGARGAAASSGIGSSHLAVQRTVSATQPARGAVCMSVAGGADARGSLEPEAQPGTFAKTRQRKLLRRDARGRSPAPDSRSGSSSQPASPTAGLAGGGSAASSAAAAATAAHRSSSSGSGSASVVVLEAPPPSHGSAGSDSDSDSSSGSGNNILPFSRMTQPRALVLDCAYRPINVLTWYKAFHFDYFGKGEVLEYYPPPAVCVTGTGEHPLPAVIRVPQYTADMNDICSKVACTRRNIMVRDGFMCQYCGSKKDLTIDHIHPQSKGGGDSWDNLVACCQRCNQKKGDRPLKDLGWKLKRTPKEPSPYDIGIIAGISTSDLLRPPPQWVDYIAPYREKFERHRQLALEAGMANLIEMD